MGVFEKIIILLCTVATARAHTHGWKLIIILALAYLLQKNQKKGNQKPKSLFRRSTDVLQIAPDDNSTLHSASSILQRALELDQLECAQRAVCRLGLRQTNGNWWNEKDRLLFLNIFGNKTPRSKGEEAFQAAANYGLRPEANETACRHRYNKCPHSDLFVDSLLAGIG